MHNRARNLIFPFVVCHVNINYLIKTEVEFLETWNFSNFKYFDSRISCAMGEGFSVSKNENVCKQQNKKLKKRSKSQITTEFFFFWFPKKEAKNWDRDVVTKRLLMTAEWVLNMHINKILYGNQSRFGWI